MKELHLTQVAGLYMQVNTHVHVQPSALMRAHMCTGMREHHTRKRSFLYC